MAIPQPQSQSSAVLLLLLVMASIAGALNPTDSHELSSALELLREHGYTLFTNAITTSDLQHELLTTASGAGEEAPLASFTLFAPKDEMLYALDMATDAAVYVNTLRYHIIPNHRYSFAHLQNLSSPFLDTLLPHFALLVGKLQDDDVFSETPTVRVTVDGVRIESPDIFLGSRLAVHGIDGILLSGLNMSQDSDAGANRSDTLPAAEPPVHRNNIPVEDMFQFDSNSAPPAPAEGIPPTSQFNIPSPPASTFRGNIPTVGSLTPVSHHFDWRIAPGAVESPSDGNIPMRRSPKIAQDQMEKLKNFAKKQREKHHRKGRRRHHNRRQSTHTDRLPNEL